MSDALVSIRMPRTLVRDLKLLVEPNHYLDFSEQLRSIIRQKARQHEIGSVDDMRKKVTQELLVKDERQRREELLEELRKLLEVSR